MPDLSEFEGSPVVAVGVEMPRAAGGLQEAMKFQPVEWHKGDEQFVVLRGTVGKIRFDLMDKEEPDGDQMRVHVLDVHEAFPISAEYVADYVTQKREQVRKAKEEAEGVMSLPLDEDEDLPVGDDERETADA